jgi:2-desacetyl-2-hydroxyethyl bacteriochlorophyllide A dehydrogenase
MPSLRAQACWVTEPRKAEIRELELEAPREGYALVRTLYSAISRGTEKLVFEGRVPEGERERMRAPFQEGDFPAPVKYGYINVGEVEQGPDELRGEKVFCLYPHQSRYVVPVSALTPLADGLAAERAVLLAGMETALNVIWDAQPKVGDSIRVVGAGVIGCLCAYLAGQIAGTCVQLIDTNLEREPVAHSLGVEFAHPKTAEGGADLVIHASGSEAGLQSALRLAGLEATIVEASWFGSGEVGLPLGGAFHSQRLRILSSQVGTLPASQRSRWTFERRMRCAMSLLMDTRLDVLITGESDFDDLPLTLKEITNSSAALCHRIKFPAAPAA